MGNKEMKFMDGWTLMKDGKREACLRRMERKATGRRDRKKGKRKGEEMKENQSPHPMHLPTNFITLTIRIVAI